jgi:hypothetical protein
VRRAQAQAYEAKPKLAVILVIDQFRGDYLDRYRDSFTTANGFNLFLKKGAYFYDCYFDYANTKTTRGTRRLARARIRTGMDRVERVVGPEAQYRSRDLFDPRAFAKGVTEKDAEQVVVDAIPAAIASLGAPALPPNNNSIVEGDRKYNEARVDPSPAIAFVRSRVDLAEGKIPATEFGRLIEHSYTANGGWYVMVLTFALKPAGVHTPF